MQNKSETIWKIPAIILCFIAMLFYSKNCSHEIDTDVDTLYIYGDTTVYTYIDTINNVDTIYYPKWLFDTINDTILDTVYIIKDYFSYKVYNDTIIDDTSLFIYVHTRIFMNNRDSFVVNYQNRRITDITINNNQNNILYGGLDFGFGIKPELSYLYNDWIFNIGYNVTNNYTTIGIKRKLWHFKH